MSLQQGIAWLLMGAASTIIGCDSSAPAKYEFVVPQGKVCVGKRGLPHVMVMLVPSKDGLRARGITNGSGEFALISENGTPGVAAGEYIVLLNRMKLHSRDQRGEDLEGFETTGSSPIRVHVTRETKRLDINLQTYEENRP